MLWRAIVGVYPQAVSDRLEGEMCTFMLCWFLCQRRETCLSVITGEALASWMWWASYLPVLNDRLQLVVEETVSDFQCGFRAGRGRVDMIFCIRQLLEKAIEHNTKLLLLFVDLRKAYDSVPRVALWCYD